MADDKLEPPKPPAPDPHAVAARSAALSDEALLLECDVDVFTGSGPGGQHRNKTESAVRLMHRPTGLSVSATERRSQYQNRQEALARLREKLVARSVRPRPRKKTRPSRAVKRRRVEAKRRHSEKKRDRRSW